jgi:uncharacterized protein (DUF934 family)
MAKLIRQGRIRNETWPQLEAGAGEAQAQDLLDSAVEHAHGVLVPLALWLAQARDWSSLAGRFGVLIAGTDDPAPLAADLSRIPLIAVHFPRFGDGRGYSVARLLRGRYAYRGELRAIGDVLRDQLFYLKRVGFDAFELRTDQDAEESLRALADFSETYQAAADQPLPLFRRRVA